MGDNQLTQSFIDGVYNLRFELQDENDISRHTFILTADETRGLIEKIMETTKGIIEIEKNFGR